VGRVRISRVEIKVKLRMLGLKRRRYLDAEVEVSFSIWILCLGGLGCS